MGYKKKANEPIALKDHIRELTRRLISIAVVAIIASSVAYNYQKEIVAWLLAPLGDQHLMYITPGGGFSFIFQVTMNIGIACAIPVAFYNLFRFISPALPKKIRNLSIAMALSSFGLMIAGAAFGYYIAIPGAMKFLTTIAAEYINASLTAESYLSFVMTYTIGLSVLFQLPLVFLLIHWVKPLKPTKLLKGERWAILGSFIVAALITPTPDIVNQLLVAAPLIVMYQMGVILVAISIYREKRRQSKLAKRASHIRHRSRGAKGKKRDHKGSFVNYRQKKRNLVIEAMNAGTSTTPVLSNLALRPASMVSVVSAPVAVSLAPQISVPPVSMEAVAPTAVRSNPVVPRHHERSIPRVNYSEQRSSLRVQPAARTVIAQSAPRALAIDGISPKRVVGERSAHAA